MPLPPFLSKIIGSGAGDLVTSLGNAIDQLTMSKEEKEAFKQDMIKEVNRNTERITELANQEGEMYLKDTQSARDSNAAIQNSEHASWLSKNVAYFIDVFFIVVFAVMLVMILYKSVPEKNTELFYTAFGALTAYVSQIINFHRGTSIGSKNSGDTLRKLAEKKG